MSFYFIQFLSGCAGAMTLFLAASGLTLVFGVTRIINFAHGSFYMLGAYLAYSLSQKWGGDSFAGYMAAMLCSAVVVALFAVVVEKTVLTRIYRAPELFQLLATFALALIVQDAVLKIWGAEDKLGLVMPHFNGAFEIAGGYVPLYDLFLILAGGVVCLALWLLLYKTRFGLLLRAATADRGMAAALGIPEKFLFTATFALGAFLAAFAGALQLPKEPANLNMDMGIIVEAFAVVVIGGMGSLPGAFIAAFLIAQMQAFSILIWPQGTLVLLFLIMAAVLVVRPQGLFARPLPPHPVNLSDAPLRRLTQNRIKLALMVLAAAALYPLLAGEYGLVLGTEIMLFILFAASLHFMQLLGGIISFGHAAYFGISAYAAAMLAQHWQWDMIPSILAAPFFAAFAALAFGWFCMRLSGIYMAMLTLACAQVVWSFAFQAVDITGGENGMIGLWPEGVFAEKSNYYYLCLGVVAVGVVTLYKLAFSRFGFALRGQKDSEPRAISLGFNPHHLRLAAFVAGGFFAGLSGALYLYAKGNVFPDYVGIHKSLDVLLMLILGGVNSLWAPILGVPAYVLLYDHLTRHFEMWRLALGVMILAIVLFLPNGLSSLRLRRRR